MNKKVSLTIGIIVLILLVVGIMGYKQFSSKQTINKVTKKYGYEDEEILAYVEDKYGFTVSILENEGRKTGSAEKGLTVHDAIVETTDEERLQFPIHISAFGNISGDDYEEVRLRNDLNETFQESEMFQELRVEGFTSLTFGEGSEDPAFSMALPEDKQIGDPEVHASLFESLPILKKVQEQAEQEGYTMEDVQIAEVTIPLNKEYESTDDLANKLAAENIDAFTYLFYKEDFAKVGEEEFAEAGFDVSLTCKKMVIHTVCDEYSLTLRPIGQEVQTDEEFRYDDEADRQQLFDGILLSREIALPIDTVLVDNMVVPFKPEDQKYSGEVLQEREGEVQVMTSFEIEVKDFREIDSAEEIYLDYVG
ncbi:hypothetical protein [Oceanobacillus picturae]|uniref:hypothetical protein n=1 Tax=Oceanobacillus picturae TaxID=171693 RepID=UPI003644E79F